MFGNTPRTLERTVKVGSPAQALGGDDADDSLGAWVAGAASTGERLETLRLGDGLDDACLGEVERVRTLRCLNLMHTYALHKADVALRGCLQALRLVALSVRVDGRGQSADEIAQTVASSPTAATLRILAVADLVVDDRGVLRGTLTDAGLAVLCACVNLERLLVEDATALTARGVVAGLGRAKALRQLGLRRCFSAAFSGASDVARAAASADVALLWEPRADGAGAGKVEA